MAIKISQVPPPEPPKPEPTYTLEGLSKTQLQVVRAMLGRTSGDIDELGSYRLYQSLGDAGIWEGDGPFVLTVESGKLNLKKKR